jgi:hypothetical protein
MSAVLVRVEHRRGVKGATHFEGRRRSTLRANATSDIHHRYRVVVPPILVPRPQVPVRACRGGSDLFRDDRRLPIRRIHRGRDRISARSNPSPREIIVVATMGRPTISKARSGRIVTARLCAPRAPRTGRGEERRDRSGFERVRPRSLTPTTCFCPVTLEAVGDLAAARPDLDILDDERLHGDRRSSHRFLLPRRREICQSVTSGAAQYTTISSLAWRVCAATAFSRAGGFDEVVAAGGGHRLFSCA